MSLRGSSHGNSTPGCWAGFAAAALLLAAIGIYGLLAYSVGQRRRELGIRLALGASRGDVVSQVVGDGIRLAGAGIGLGVVIALAVTRSEERRVGKECRYGVRWVG